MIKTSWKQVMAAVLALTVTHIFVPSQDIEAKIVKNKNKKSSVKKRSKSRKIKSKKGKNVKKTKNKGSKKRGSKRSLGGGSTGSGGGGGGGSTGSGSTGSGVDQRNTSVPKNPHNVQTGEAPNIHSLSVSQPDRTQQNTASLIKLFDVPNDLSVGSTGSGQTNTQVITQSSVKKILKNPIFQINAATSTDDVKKSLLILLNRLGPTVLNRNIANENMLNPRPTKNDVQVDESLSLDEVQQVAYLNQQETDFQKRLEEWKNRRRTTNSYIPEVFRDWLDFFNDAKINLQPYAINGDGLCWLRAILVAFDAQETHKEPTSRPEQQKPKSPYYTQNTGTTFIQKVEQSSDLDAVLPQLIAFQKLNDVQNAWEQWHTKYTQVGAHSGPSTTLAEKLGPRSMQEVLGVNDTYEDYTRVLEQAKNPSSLKSVVEKQLLIRALLTVPFHTTAKLPINMQEYDQNTGLITSKDKPADLEETGIIPLFNQLFDRDIIVIDTTSKLAVSRGDNSTTEEFETYILNDNIDRNKTIVLLKYNRKLKSAKSGAHYDLLWYKQ